MDGQNTKGADLHMATHAAVPGAVVPVAMGVLVKGWTWLDPAVAIAVSLLIAVAAAESFHMALHMILDFICGNDCCRALQLDVPVYSR